MVQTSTLLCDLKESALFLKGFKHRVSLFFWKDCFYSVISLKKFIYSRCVPLYILISLHLATLMNPASSVIIFDALLCSLHLYCTLPLPARQGILVVLRLWNWLVSRFLVVSYRLTSPLSTVWYFFLSFKKTPNKKILVLMLLLPVDTSVWTYSRGCWLYLSNFAPMKDKD